MATKPTFLNTMLTRSEDYRIDAERFALAAREMLANAKPQGATEAYVVTVRNGNRHYMLVAHNGNPFENYDDMVSGLTPSTSGGLGVQGSGMKASAFLFTNKSDAELIVYSKCKDGKKNAISMTVKNFNDVCHTEVSDTIPQFIDNLFAEISGITVAYMVYFMPPSATKNNKKPLACITSGSHIRLLVELCPDIFREMRVQTSFNHIVFSDDRPITGLDTIVSTDTFDQHYMHDSVTIELPNCTSAISRGADREEKIEYDAVVTFKLYNNLRKISQDTGRLIRYKTDNVDDITVANQYEMVSGYALFAYVEPRIDKGSKDFSRLINQPIYFAGTNHKNLTTVDLPASRSINFKDYVKEFYPDVHAKYDNTVIWKPYIQSQVRIIPKQERMESMHDFGNFNEFWDAVNHHRINDIISDVFERLNTDSPENFVQFRDKIYNEYFPKFPDGLAPLPITVEDTSYKIGMYRVTDGVKVNKLKPGEMIDNVVFRYWETNQLVTEPIQFLHNNIGVYNPATGTYLFKVSELGKLDDGKFTAIKAEDYSYKQVDGCVPRRVPLVVIDGKQYRIVASVDLPVDTPKGGNPPVGNRPNPKDNDEGKQERYSADKYNPSSPEVYATWKNNTLMFNPNNAFIKAITGFGTDPSRSRCQNLLDTVYKDMEKIARRVVYKDLADDGQWQFTPDVYQQLVSLYEDTETYIINRHLESYIITSDKVNKLRELVGVISGSETE